MSSLKITKKKISTVEDLKLGIYSKFLKKRKNKALTASYRLNTIKLEQGRKVSAGDPYASDVTID